MRAKAPKDKVLSLEDLAVIVEHFDPKIKLWIGVDTSTRMDPFVGEAKAYGGLINGLWRKKGGHCENLVVQFHGQHTHWWPEEGDELNLQHLNGQNLILLSDLGGGYGPIFDHKSDEQDLTHIFGNLDQSTVLVLNPYPLSTFNHAFLKKLGNVSSVSWSEKAMPPRINEVSKVSKVPNRYRTISFLEYLSMSEIEMHTYCSLMRRVTMKVLRQIHLRYFPDLPVGVRGRMIYHPVVQSSNSQAFCLKPEIQKIFYFSLVEKLQNQKDIAETLYALMSKELKENSWDRLRLDIQYEYLMEGHRAIASIKDKRERLIALIMKDHESSREDAIEVIGPTIKEIDFRLTANN